MPIHEWTRVDAGIFHAFHLNWIAELNKALNGGLLPSGYYALPEQNATTSIPDLPTLHASPDLAKPLCPAPKTGGLTLAIRHVGGHRLVAIVEIVSSTDKDRLRSVAEFAGKIVAALAFGVHALVIDLLPPGPHDLTGMHGAIWQRLEKTEEPYDLPEDDPLTLASYVAAEPVDIYLEHPAIGASLAEMPLFLRPDRYINVPLDTTYQEAYRSMPAFWRDVLDAG
jgi:hypothetical protein